MGEEDTSMNFAAICREVAENFLQSAVILDDLAWMGPLEHHATQQVALQPPDYDVSTQSSQDAGTSTPDGVPLDAKAVVDGFVEFGMVCAVLRFGEEETTWSKVRKAAIRSDIVILDWKIGDSYGDKVLEVIQCMLNDDQHGERLRLLAIYTGEPDLAGIAGQVKETINQFYDNATLICGDPYRMTKGPVHVVVLAKQGAGQKGVPDTLDQEVAEADLANRLIDEFSRMTVGLLRNVAMEGLAVVRNETYRILGKFNPELDPAYLGHRLLLPYPEDAESHLVEALGAELLSILAEHRPGTMANATAIRAWLKAKTREGLDLSFPLSYSQWEGEGSCVEYWMELLTKGIDGEGVTKPTPRKKRRDVAEVFVDDKEAALESNRLLARLLSLKTCYSSNPPRLMLGTILGHKSERESQYLLCLQPKCDSVRLQSATGFPLVRLDKAAANKEFDLVVQDEGDQWVHLKIPVRLACLIIVTFCPGPNPPGEVVASGESGAYCFRSADGEDYRWIADMKDEHALKAAGNLAATLSRPAPNDSEWQRRSGRS